MLEENMEFEASLVDLHRIMRALSQENAALRTLLDDYEQLVDAMPSLTIIAWEMRHTELKARYDALMKGGKP